MSHIDIDLIRVLVPATIPVIRTLVPGPPGPSALPRSLRQFGAIGDGLVDDRPAILSAFDSGEPLTVGPGEYLVDGTLPLYSGLTMKGTSKTASVFKLADGANANVFYGLDVDDISLSHFGIDGNKANQTNGIVSRGIYLPGTNSRITLDGIHVKQIKDHGIFFSGLTSGIDSLVLNCSAADVGQAEHLAAGGPGGSSFLGSVTSLTWLYCVSRRGYLNGGKINQGTIAFCQFLDSVAGGGLELGFGADVVLNVLAYGNVLSNNAGNGVRNIGQGDKLRLIGNTIQNNGRSGIALAQNADNVEIQHNHISDNGQLIQGPRNDATDTAGVDNIFLGSTSAGSSHCLIDNNYCYFTEEVVGQITRYNLYVDNLHINLRIGSGNNFSEVVAGTEVLHFNSSHEGSRIGSFLGHSADYRDTDVTTLTGTVAVTTLKSMDIAPYHAQVGSTIRGEAGGVLTGAAGIKRVRFLVGGESRILFAVTTPTGSGQWRCEFRIACTNSGAWFITYSVWLDETVTTTVTPFLVGIGLASVLTILFNGECVDAADTITMTYLKTSFDG